MNITDSIILGVVQGITEFLPISSTGHLILMRDFFGIADTDGLAFDAILHLSTALAIAFFFRVDIARMLQKILRPINFIRTGGVRLLAPYIIAGVPVVIVGLLAEGYIESIFRSSTLVAFMLIAGGVLFIVSEKVGDKRPAQTNTVSIKQAFFIGLLQVLALIPGMSRSGSTISAGLISGVSRTTSARFTFLMALPLLIGAGAKKFFDISGDASFEYAPLIVASLTSFAVGYISLRWLMRILSKKSLIPFAVYRFVLAGVILAFF